MRAAFRIPSADPFRKKLGYGVFHKLIRVGVRTNPLVYQISGQNERHAVMYAL